MSEKVKQAGEALMEAFNNLPDSKKEFLLGYGVMFMSPIMQCNYRRYPRVAETHWGYSGFHWHGR